VAINSELVDPKCLAKAIIQILINYEMTQKGIRLIFLNFDLVVRQGSVFFLNKNKEIFCKRKISEKDCKVNFLSIIKSRS